MPSRPHRPNAPATRTARGRWLAVSALATALVVPMISPTGAQAATVVPRPTVTLPTSVDVATTYREQYSCDPAAKAGVEQFLRVLLKTYPMGHSGGIVRGCGIGSTSEHKEGRALDFMLSIYKADQKAAGDALTQWLTGKDSRGVVGGNARRLGVMYVIWNRRIWGAYNSTGWRTYSGASPHTDHVHISFSWDGAMARTSWWDGSIVTNVDQGPCPVYTGQPAPVYTTRRSAACPATKTSPTSTYGIVWPGQTTSSVKVAQKKLGVTADGVFGSGTRSALFSWQRGSGVPITGVLDKPTWARLVPSSTTTPTPTPSPAPDTSATTTPLTPYKSSTLVKGARGAAVVALQAVLGITADGVFGSDTEATVKAFQQWKGLSVTGVVDPAMWSLLEKTAYPLLGYRSTVLRKGSSGTAVKALQRALGITADGAFGSGTEAAVKSAQTKAGLSATGVVDTATWIAIESAAYPVPSLTTPPVPRIAGVDRYATAAKVSENFAPGVALAFVASGEHFPDALSGAAAAGAKRAPVLLSGSDSLPAATAAALVRLKPQAIVMLGGTSMLSGAVQKQLASYTAGTVSRISGPDRYATAAAVSKHFTAAGVDVAYVASGETFPDGLAGAALAGARRRPVLLTSTGTSLPVSTVDELKRLRPGRIVVLGGKAVVSDRVVTQLQGLTAGTVTRLAGRDRYETARLIADEFNAGAPVAYVANGESFPDALAGAALAARAASPVVLVVEDRVPAAASSALTRLQADEINVLGGQTMVSDIVASALRAFTAG